MTEQIEARMDRMEYHNLMTNKRRVARGHQMHDALVRAVLNNPRH